MHRTGLEFHYVACRCCHSVHGYEGVTRHAVARIVGQSAVLLVHAALHYVYYKFVSAAA